MPRHISTAARTLLAALLILALCSCESEDKALRDQVASLNATATALEAELARVNQEYADYKAKKEAESSEIASCVAECRKTRDLERSERLYEMASIAAAPFETIDDDKDGRISRDEFYAHFPHAPSDAVNLITGFDKKFIDPADWQAFKTNVSATALAKAQSGGAPTNSTAVLLPPENPDAKGVPIAPLPKSDAVKIPPATPTPAASGGTLRLPVPVRRNPQ